MKMEPTLEFTVEDAHYTLVETELGDFLLHATAPLAAGKFPHELLTAEHGPLTTLELVLALAPDHQPGERLVAYHEREAEAYGRPDSAIRNLDFVEPLIDKGVGADCIAYAVSIYGGEETEGEFVYRNGDPVLWDTEYTHDREVLAICNPAISEIPYYFGWQYEGYSMNYFGQQTLLEDHRQLCMVAMCRSALPGGAIASLRMT